tara:strand:- start:139 stop:411 length:273 start_codon:yes stop_codon:yes gene_type:complete
MNTFTIEIADILEELDYNFTPSDDRIECYFESVGNDGEYTIDEIFIMGTRKTISLDNMKESFKDLVQYSIQRDTGHYIWSDWSIQTMQER